MVSMKKNYGFTLIELLVVIAIIAILAAILFPVFANAKEKARVTTCVDNLKNLSQALKMYADDNGGKMPKTYNWLPHFSALKDWCGCLVPSDVHGVDVTKSAIWGYCGRNKKIFLCPTDVKVMTTAPGMTVQGPDYPISYSMNYKLAFEDLFASPSAPLDPNRISWPIVDTIKSQSKVLLLIHEGRRNIDDGCFAWGAGNRGANSANLPTDVHYNGSCASYLDGHAKWISYNALLMEQDSNQWAP